MNQEKNQAEGDESQVPKSNGAFLGPLSILARQKKTWSPALLAGILWRAITNIDTHRKVVGLLKVAPFSQALASNPRFAFKYLAPHYLARRLTITERATCFLHHHQRMLVAFSGDVLRQIMQGDILVHQIVNEEHRFAFTTGLSRPCDKEGELSLNLYIDDDLIFVLSFTIVPGSIVGSNSAEVVLLTRMQGSAGCFPKIKMASAALHDVGLNALLFAALQGFATAFGIGEIVASCAVDQTSYADELAAVFQRAYDDFYLDLGMTKTETGYFSGAIPIEGRPLDQVKRSHKSRTKDQRRFKQEIQSVFETFFRQIVDRAPAVSDTICFRPTASCAAIPSSRPISWPTLDH